MRTSPAAKTAVSNSEYPGISQFVFPMSILWIAGCPPYALDARNLLVTFSYVQRLKCALILRLVGVLIRHWHFGKVVAKQNGVEGPV